MRNQSEDLLTAITEANSWAVLVTGCVCFIVGLRFVQRRPRLQEAGKAIGFAVMLAVFALLCAESSSDRFLSNAFKAWFWAILATGISWIALPILALLHYIFVVRPRGQLERWRATQQARAQRRRTEAEHEARQARERIARQHAEAEAVRRAQEREAERGRQHEQARAQEAENVRKRSARAACERLFNLHEAEIKARFDRATFHEFMRRYMGDDHPADYVEAQAEELKKLIEQHRLKIEPPKKMRTIADAAAWFEEQKRQLDQISDDRLRRSLVVQLKAKYAELTSQMMDEIE